MPTNLSLIFYCDDSQHLAKRSADAIVAAAENGCQIIIADRTEGGLNDYVHRRLKDASESVCTLRLPSTATPWSAIKQSIAAANCEYIAFRSPEIWVENGTDTRLVELMDHTHADIMQFARVKRQRHKSTKVEMIVEDYMRNRLLTGEEFRFLTRYIGDMSYVSGSLFDKMFKRQLLSESMKIDFPDLFAYDEILVLHYMRHARSLYFADSLFVQMACPTDYSSVTGLPTDSSKLAYQHKKLVGMDAIAIADELKGRILRRLTHLINEAGWTPEAMEFFLRRELVDPVWSEVGIPDDSQAIIESVVRDKKNNLAKRIFSFK